MQDELTSTYRLQSENAQTLLRLKEQSEQDEGALLKKGEEIMKCRLTIDGLQDRIKENLVMRIIGFWCGRIAIHVFSFPLDHSDFDFMQW